MIAASLTPEALRRAAEDLSRLVLDGRRITFPEPYLPRCVIPELYLHLGWKSRFGFEPTDRMFIVGDHLEVLHGD